MVLYFSYSATIVNIETAFLYWDMEEEICIECLQGMFNVKKDNCINLNKCIYQAARRYYKNASKF